MAEARGPSVYTIPPHRAFADAIAAGLIAQHRGDPLALARGTILIPNNRAARAITDAFVRRADTGGLLLPRMVAVGDPELDERLGVSLDPLDADAPLPPAIDPMERQLILARLVQDVRETAGDPVDAAEALRLAIDLARTLDQLIVEKIPVSRLTDSVAPELSHHWQASLAMLEIILSLWPEQLARKGRIDLADRRNQLLARAADRWQRNSPAGFVVAAGITTSAPAVANLLRIIANLPKGIVVFPHIDCEMVGAEWDALGPFNPNPETGVQPRSIETHPQFHLKLLLDRMGIGRGEVRRWRWGGRADAPAVRSKAISHAMTPAAFTDKWQTLKPSERRLSGVRAAVFAGPAEEAQAIALALRQAIETPGRTAALVTPDRNLATRVTAHLARWTIAADDSAGIPLSLTPPGTLLLGIAELAAEQFAPVPLLAVLKHPLVHTGDERAAWLAGTRLLDRALRGPRPAAGLQGLREFLAEGDERAARIRKPAGAWWNGASALFQALEAALATPSLSNVLAALRETATALAADAVWSGPAGRAAAELIADLEAHAADGPRLTRPDALSTLLRTLMDGIAIRPPQGGHPRIFIWGLLEARLQHADLMILGGLNEGVWPAAPSPDPWLAPAVRRVLGLPGLERRIGLSAHDFATALGAPQILVTRARRDARAPTLASRFLLRLEAMTGGLTRAPRVTQWMRAIDRPSATVPPAARPAPNPPVADRPRQLAVTKLDRLKADPFAFYADAMLRLSPWDAVDADPDARWRGTAIHDVFEAWMKEDRCDPDLLAARARAKLAETSAHPVMRALWEPRLMEAIDWVAEEMRAARAKGREPIVAEIFGDIEFEDIKLYGKVDRIDRLADGSLAIVDYKTGQAPSRSQVEAGFSMQLGLLGMIAENHGFPEINGTPLTFEYWSLAAKKGALGHISSPVGEKAMPREDFTAYAASILSDAIERWLKGTEPFIAKLRPDLAPYPDYDQLMRLDEWYGRGDV